MEPTVVEPPAVRRCLGYLDPQEKQQLFQRLVAGEKCDVIGIATARRPLWSHRVRPDLYVCFIFIEKLEGLELRLLRVMPQPASTDVARDILFDAGEIVDEQKSRVGRITVSKLPPRPGVTFDEVGGSFNAYISPAPSLVDAWKRQESLHQAPPLLGKDQERAVLPPPPLLIQGVAGSGKTTLMAYLCFRKLEAVAQQDLAPRIALVVYNDELKAYSERLLEQLFSARRIDERAQWVSIRTYREVCNEILKSTPLELDEFDWVPTSAHAEVKNALRAYKRQHSLNVPPSLSDEIIEEIVGVIKGGNLKWDEGRDLMDKEEYLNLPSSDSLIDRQYREEVYRLARAYQAHLCRLRKSRQPGFDEMDAARVLLTSREAWGHKHFDFVLVDEAQDFTPIQHAFLCSLASAANGLVFAGDEEQVVRPSHFRWNRLDDVVRKVFGEIPVSRQTLHMNRRNPKAVIEFAQCILGKRNESLSKKSFSSDVPIASGTIAPTPMRIKVAPGEASRVIECLATNIAKIGVIVPTEDEKLSVSRWGFKGIEFGRAFLPEECKGLEFLVVCLLNLGVKYARLEDVDFASTVRANVAKAYNEIYVSVTRCQGPLLLIDEVKPGDAQPTFWDILHDYAEQRGLGPIFEDYHLAIDRSEAIPTSGASPPSIGAIANQIGISESLVAQLQNWVQGFSLSSTEWSEEGPQPEYYGTGREPYRISGPLIEALEKWQSKNLVNRFAVAAHEFSMNKNYDAAAECWMRIGEYELAGKCYERGNKLRNAANAYVFAGRLILAARLYIRLTDAENAATLLDILGQHDSAAKYWRQAKNHARASRSLELVGRIEDAAKAALESEDPERAGDLFERAEKYHAAAQCWENAIQDSLEPIPGSIAQLIRRGASCWSVAFHQPNIATHVVQLTSNCAENVLLDRYLAYMIEWWRENDEQLRAAEALDRIKQHRQASKLYGELNEPVKAGRSLAMANDYLGAAETVRGHSTPDELSYLRLALKQLDDDNIPQLRSIVRLIGNAGELIEATSILEQINQRTADTDVRNDLREYWKMLADEFATQADLEAAQNRTQVLELRAGVAYRRARFNFKSAEFFDRADVNCDAQGHPIPSARLAAVYETFRLYDLAAETRLKASNLPGCKAKTRRNLLESAWRCSLFGSDRRLSADIASALANAHETIGDFTRSIDFRRSACEQFREAKAWTNAAEVMIDIAQQSGSKEDWQAALTSAEAANDRDLLDFIKEQMQGESGKNA